MCDQNSLQQHIHRLTNDGEVVARFLTDTVQGKTPGAKACHQVKAMEYLVRFGLTDQTATPNRHSAEHIPAEAGSGNPQGQGASGINTPFPSTGEGWDGGDVPARTQPAKEPADAQDRPTDNSKLNTGNSPVTYLDILNYELAQLVRSETAEGHTIAQFLYHVMTGRDKPFTPNKLRIKPADRMTAAMEILRRGHGHFGRRRKLIDDAEETNDYDTLHTDLAKRLRQYGNHGSDVIRFLLDVMKNDFPDDQFTYRHRLSAALELNRRGWDTNYDRIKMEHLMDYWRDQQDAVLSVGQKKHLAGLHTYADEYDLYDNKSCKDYEYVAKQFHAQQDRESEARDQEKREESRITTPLPPQGEGWDGGEAPAHPEPANEQADAQDRPTDNSELTTQDSPDCYYAPPESRRPGNLRLPGPDRVRRIQGRRDPASPGHRDNAPRLPSNPQVGARDRRSRRHPPSPEPPIRHPTTPQRPQPLVNQSLPPQGGRLGWGKVPFSVSLCVFCGYPRPVP